MMRNSQPNILLRLVALLMALLMLPSMPVAASTSPAQASCVKPLAAATSMKHMACCKPGHCRCCLGKGKPAGQMACGCGVRSTAPEHEVSISTHAQRLAASTFRVVIGRLGSTRLATLGVNMALSRSSLPLAPPPQFS